MSCKLRCLFIYSTKFYAPSTITGGVKLFFTKNQTLEILQLSNANLSVDFLKYDKKEENKQIFFCSSSI